MSRDNIRAFFKNRPNLRNVSTVVLSGIVATYKNEYLTCEPVCAPLRLSIYIHIQLTTHGSYVSVLSKNQSFPQAFFSNSYTQ